MKISLITPAAKHIRAGNRTTAVRWARILRRLGHRVDVATAYADENADLMVALHAWRSADAVARFRELHPDRPLVVALTGTDIYRFLESHPGPTLASMAAADALAAFGGLEIAAMAGALIGAASRGAVVLVDGFIATAAALAALAARPEAKFYCVFAHRSKEPGHVRMLEWLGVEPLIDLDLRLGEGTGALLALPLLRSACAMLNEMATFESAGVSGKDK